MEHKDYLGRPLAVDDYVVFVIPEGRQLQHGRITKLTNKNVRIAYTSPHSWQKNTELTVVRPPKDVVRIEGPDLTMYLLRK